MNFDEKRLKRETKYQGRVFNLHVDTVELQDGSRATREVVEHHGGVAVLALDAQDNVLMVKQYRYGAGRPLWELPAGKIDPGEDPEATGLRELEEETGFVADRMEYLGKFYPTPAYDTEIIYLYLAKGLTPTRQDLDPGEFLSVEKMPLSEAIALCADGTIQDSKTLIAVLRYAAQQKERI